MNSRNLLFAQLSGWWTWPGVLNKDPTVWLDWAQPANTCIPLYFSGKSGKSPAQWNSMFFAFSLIIEGTTEKVLQFKIPLKLIYNQTLALLNKKCIFEHKQRSSNNEKAINWHDFCYEKNFLVNYSELQPEGLC